MLEFQQKRKIRKILYSPLSLIALAVIAVVFTKGAWNVYEKESTSGDYLDQARTELSKVSATRDDLAASVQALQTQQGIETDIRHKFRVVKPGEQIAVIVDGDASNSAATSTLKGGFWASLWSFF